MTGEMIDSCDLSNRDCVPCKGGVPPLTDAESKALLEQLDGWRIDGVTLVKRLTFKGFAKATYHANLAAFLGDKEGHHPDISFGWGYCQVVFTTHEAGGLTENDFICAAKFDRLCAA